LNLPAVFISVAILPKVLHGYTGELIQQVDYLLFGWEDGDGNKNRGKIQKFYEGAAGGAAKAMIGNPEGLAANMLKGISREPWYVQAIAQKLLPTLEKATENLGKPSKEPVVPTWNPGIDLK